MHRKERLTQLGIKIFLAYLLIPPLVAAAFVASSPVGDERNSARIEAELSKWKRPAAHTSVPKQLTLVHQGNFTGTWSIGHGLDSSRLELSKRKGNTFKVRFRTSGCLASWELRRTAEFMADKGALRLNKPITEYSPSTYDLLYVVKRKSEMLLLPASALSKCEKSFFSWDYYAYCKE